MYADIVTRDLFTQLMMNGKAGEVFTFTPPEWALIKAKCGLKWLLEINALRHCQEIKPGVFRMVRGEVSFKLVDLCEQMAPFGWRLTKVELETSNPASTLLRVYDGDVMMPMEIPRAFTHEQAAKLALCRSMFDVMAIIRAGT